MLDLLVKEAASDIGLKEITGPIHNETIVGWFKELGLPWFNNDETAWCAIYVNIKLKRRQLPYFTGEKAARAAVFSDYGKKIWSKGEPLARLADARPGDICVYEREGGGHVHFFFGFTYDLKHVLGLGGNQSNMVNIAAYSIDKLVAIRRPPVTTGDKLQVPAYPLVGKDEISRLQAILQFYGFYKGSLDGSYGPGTLAAVRAFQEKHGLPENGQYSNAMKEKIFSILNA